MARKKTKVANRQKTKRHAPSRRRTSAGSGGGGGGGALGGLRGGFRSIVGSGRSRREKQAGQGFWTVAMWVLLAAAVAIFVGRYAC